MAGKKRTRNGQVKPSDAIQLPPAETPTVNGLTPPCAQPHNSSAPSQSTSSAESTSEPKAALAKQDPSVAIPRRRPRRNIQKHDKPQKLPKLPASATVTKRPLLHPQIPTPFASSSAPKIVYITPSTPFISARKRIRKLLVEILRREKQSLAKSRKAPRADGSLRNGQVERDMADQVARKNKTDGEKVYVKATGRAIPRALELGVAFQEEEEWAVRVEMGSVRAIDDIDVNMGAGDEGTAEELPETRIRNVSSVTVSIGIK